MSTQTAAPHPEPSTPVSDGRCQRLRADGKRCAAPVYSGHASLCHFHLSREMRGISDGELLAADILNSIGNFQSATAINLALGKIFLHQITGRLSRQDALALCYNCQLLLHSLPSVKHELVDGGFHHHWREETARILSSNQDLCHQTNSVLLPTGHGPLKPVRPVVQDSSTKPNVLSTPANSAGV
ncbi:MAG TPA: hypothetical protein VKT53_13545 [Candidatus Acidoferrum sp.]|nr:hypothetical protein [Candidatus Acidoferrum sp.]